MSERLTLSSVQMLDEIIAVKGQPCRTWRGLGPNGEEVFLMVAMVFLPTPEAQKLFEVAPVIDPKKLN